MSVKFSQVFLVDRNILKKIESVVKPYAKFPFFEIGPGKGYLTEHLLKITKKYVVAVEIDTKLAGFLKTHFKNEIEQGKLRLHVGDVLKQDFTRLFEEKVVVVSNIPYEITGPLLRKIVENIFLFETIFLTVQLEVARKIVATQGSRGFGTLSLLIQGISKPRILFVISRKSFSPIPEVDSAFIEITPYPEKVKNLKDFLEFVDWARQIYRYPRKTMRKIFKLIGYDTELLNRLADKRPSQITIEELYNLFMACRGGRALE